MLTWLSAMAAAAGAALMWRNLVTFSLVLDAATAAALLAQRDRPVGDGGAVPAAGAASAARRRRRASVWAPLFVAHRRCRRWRRRWRCAAAACRRCSRRGRSTRRSIGARPDATGRVTVIAIDAASLDLITSATAEGRLPNFGRILDAGAVRHLATLHPTSAEAVWAAVATGKLPQKNGVRSSAIYQLAGGGGAMQLLPDYCFAHGLERFGFLVEQPHTSATLRTRTLWSILSTEGFSVGVVGWPLTQPAPVVRGYVVSDTYHRVALTASGIDDPSAIYPPELQLDALAAMESAMNDAPPVVTASIGSAGRAASTPGTRCRRAPIASTTASPQAMSRAQAGAGDAHAIPEPRCRSATTSCATRSRPSSAT